MRPVVLFDLDGVLIKTPDDLSGTISDPDFWHNRWTNPRNQTPNTPMIDLLRSLTRAGLHVCIFTGRPDTYEHVTVETLMSWGLRVIPDTRPRPNHLTPSLVMKPEGASPMGHDSGWKSKKIVEWADDGMDVLFMVEDYKVNADAIRKHIPVLLFERMK